MSAHAQVIPLGPVDLTALPTDRTAGLLRISPAEQRKRLLARLDQPTKHWKYNPHDVDERARWADYREAYEIAIERTNTEAAPWRLVPSDHKWYRNLAIGELLLATLNDLDPDWPVADFDVDAERARLTGEEPIAESPAPHYLRSASDKREVREWRGRVSASKRGH